MTQSQPQAVHDMIVALNDATLEIYSHNAERIMNDLIALADNFTRSGDHYVEAYMSKLVKVLTRRLAVFVSPIEAYSVESLRQFLRSQSALLLNAYPVS